MYDPFYRSHWNSPFYPMQRRSSSRRNPVHDVRTTASPRVIAVHPQQRIRSAEPSKVVMVPVHFIDTDRRRSESESAVMIQKVFRGFMVRKSVKKIADVRREVDEIEKRITAKPTVDLMRRDSRERLGVNEMLMSLLLRLDSVRGVDAGVRDCRKTVIRKVIALQEALDAIVSVDNTSADAVAETTGEEVLETVEPSDPCLPTQIGHENPDLVRDEPESAELARKTVEIEVPLIQNEPTKEKSPEITNMYEGEGERVETMEQTENQTDSSANPESPVEEIKEKHRIAEEVTVEEEGKKRRNEMMDRMMEMMAELFERNELQTRLLSSLSQRVEQLEKAFVYERLRRKKKRHAVAATATAMNPETPEKPPEGKKSGR